MIVLLIIQILSQHYMAKASFTKENVVFTSYQTEYNEIKGGCVLSNTKPWGEFNQRFKVPIGFDYHFFDSSFSVLYLETSGRLVFDEDHLYFADAFSAFGLQDKGFKNQKLISPISYKDSTINGEKLLIIQFKNAGLKSDSMATLNFQIWLFSSKRQLELHMGEAQVSDVKQSFIHGPYFCIYRLNSISPLDVNARIGSTGKLRKQVFIQRGKKVNLFGDALEALPKSGTVYRLQLN